MIVAELSRSLRARILDSRALDGVRAGSALVWFGGRLLVVQDDAASAVWVDPRARSCQRVVIEGSGGALEKAAKPDFEAAFPAPDGAIRILGSGSTIARRRVARLDPTTCAARLVDCAPLYEAIAARLGVAPNIEGAVLVSLDVVRLFHRGSGADRSATVDVPFGALDGAAPAVLGATLYDLGDVGGVPLTFTDACPRGDRVVYIAAAEDTPNAIDDGPVVGAAVGVLDGERARYALLEEPDGAICRRKVEGVAFDPETGAGWLVTDPDDPELPAELCAFTIEGL